MRNLPTSWKQVPFWKGQRIMEGGLNELEIMALITDRNLSDLKASESFEDIYYATHSMEFLKDLPDFKTPIIPNSFKLDDKEYKFPHVVTKDPFDLGKASAGQVKDMEMLIITLRNRFHSDDQEKELTELEAIKMTPFITSVYIQKIIDGEYDYGKSQKLVEKVSEQMSFYDVTQIGYFFFRRLIGLKGGYQTKVLNQNLVRRKLRRAFASLEQTFKLNLN